MSWIRRLLVSALLIAAAAVLAAQSPVAPSAAASPPVFVLLVSTIEDHLNDQPSLARIERTLPVVARYRKEHPQFAASWLVRFTGTVSDHLAETNYASHLVDKLKQAALDGAVEFGYDGTDEPTFVARPRPNFRKAPTPEDRWLARVEALEWFLNEGKDPITGQPVAERTGGLRRVLDVFGRVEAVRGVTLEIGGDPELAHLVRRMKLDPLLPGFGETTVFPGRTLAGYRGSTGGASAALSPEAGTAPELFWQDGLLALSEYVGPDSKVFVAREGVEVVRKSFEALDPSRPHVIQVRLGHPGVYIKPGFGDRRYQTPLEFSYENPRSPHVPADALRSSEESAAEYAKEDDVLRWLVTDYFPAHPGSRFVSAAELKRMTGPGSGVDVSQDDVAAAAREVVETLQKAPLYLPTFVRAGDRYLSLADVFSLLVTSLAHADRSGTLPGAVPLRPLYGPRGLMNSDERNVGTRVDRAAVLRACSTLSDALFAPGWMPVPANTVPSGVSVGEREVSAAQFLLLMADAYLQPVGAREVMLRHVFPFSAVGESFPGTRPLPDRGTTWTIKPARLLRPAASTSP